MYQETYVLDEGLTLEGFGRLVAGNSRYRECRTCLVLAFEPRCDRSFIGARVEWLRATLPKAKLAGMTTLGPVGPETDVLRATQLSVIYFQDSDADVHLLDCGEAGAQEAGLKLCDAIGDAKHVKGVLLMTSCVTLTPTPVIQELEARYPDIRIFGAQAGTQTLGEDLSLVFTGDGVSDRAVLAVVLRGENLHVTTDYNLGWRPIGREMTITGQRGNDYVCTIDGETAVDVYRKYLGVEPDDAFYANVCAFPLLLSSGGGVVARVPTRYASDGSIQFPAVLAMGSKVTFSYTKPEYLLRNSLAAANDIGGFAPQALMLFCCVNRRVYMGNDRANRELSYYRRICPDTSIAYGYGEILRTPEGGGLLNSTIVSAALREGDIPHGFSFEAMRDPELASDSIRYRLLSDRLATFLEATTAELNATIQELEHMAHHDQLTGVYNRRHFDEVLAARLLNRRRRSDHGSALIMYDIDHFKTVNDTYGHETGDDVLKELTARVKAIVRDDDVLGRWGGEEFLILVSNITFDQALSLAERIRNGVASAPFADVGTVTISLGVTCVREGDTAETLFERVDKALYDAKNGGRNRVAGSS